MIDSTTMGALALGHVLAFILAVVASIHEARGQKRSVVLSGYLYVAFISVLTILAYVPIAMSIDLPTSLTETLMKVRYVAILFFLLGVLELAKKKGANW